MMREVGGLLVTHFAYVQSYSCSKESESFEKLAPRPKTPPNQTSSISVRCKHGKRIVPKVGLAKNIQGIPSGVLLMQPAMVNGKCYMYIYI